VRLAALLEHSYDAVLVRRLDGEILYWNLGAERTYGWSSEQAAGQTSHSMLRTSFPKPLVVIDEVLHSYGRWEGLLHHVRRDGRPLTVESRWVLDGVGADATVLEINRDITMRLEAEEAARARERQLRFVTDSAPVLLAHCDTGGRFKFVNRPYAARFGLQPSELTGRTIAEVIGEAAFAAIEPFTARALAGERVEVEVEVPYQAIGRQFMRFAYEPERDEQGNVVGFVAAIVNVSDRYQAEEALREADRRKDAFLATLAHELRNPLAAMRNAVHLITAPQVDETSRDRAGAIIERQLQQLVRRVDDLLDVSRISRGKLQLRIARTTLAEVLGSALESTALATAAAGQTVTVSLPDDPIALDVDAQRLSQVFINLLSNATKYTPAGGEVSLVAGATADHVTVTVGDTGAGIPPDRLEDVFEMFTQVEAPRDLAYGGLGIGLTLVRSLVELHGGTVSAHSDGPGRGTRVVVQLPRQLREAVDAPAPAAAPAEVTPMSKRILVADDNADAAESLQLWLQMAGFEVHVAFNGVDALAAAEALLPDVVLLDLGMPGMSGLEVARRIRASAWGGSLVLVALTGWGQDQDRRQTREAGFDHHLTKPVPPDDIEELIRGS
jgi:PAS domain S-box-containing protein